MVIGKIGLLSAVVTAVGLYILPRIAKEIVKRLSKKWIENGPEVSSDKPASRRMEEKLAGYYNWPLYWLPGRKVLISPRWATDIDWTERTFRIELTKHQVETSPDLESIELIDRDYEERLHGHYGFQKYWEKV